LRRVGNVLGLNVGPVLPLTLEDVALVLGNRRFITPNMHLLAVTSEAAEI